MRRRGRGDRRRRVDPRIDLRARGAEGGKEIPSRSRHRRAVSTDAPPSDFGSPGGRGERVNRDRKPRLAGSGGPRRQPPPSPPRPASSILIDQSVDRRDCSNTFPEKLVSSSARSELGGPFSVLLNGEALATVSLPASEWKPLSLDLSRAPFDRPFVVELRLEREPPKFSDGLFSIRRRRIWEPVANRLRRIAPAMLPRAATLGMSG